MLQLLKRLPKYSSVASLSSSSLSSSSLSSSSLSFSSSSSLSSSSLSFSSSSSSSSSSLISSSHSSSLLSSLFSSSSFSRSSMRMIATSATTQLQQQQQQQQQQQSSKPNSLVEKAPKIADQTNPFGKLTLDLGTNRVVIPFTEEVAVTLKHALSSHSEWVEDRTRKLEEEYLRLERELVPLQAQAAKLHVVAEKSAHRKMMVGWVYLLSQIAVVGRLTWWDLSWDIMEPVTYFIGATTGLGFYAWFIASSREFSYDSAKMILQEKKFRQLARSNGLDLDKIKQIELEMNHLRKELPITSRVLAPAPQTHH